MKSTPENPATLELDRNPQHQLPFDCRLGVVIGRDGCFKRLVIFDILQSANHRLGGKPMTDRVAARALLAFLRRWPSALSSLLKNLEIGALAVFASGFRAVGML